MALAALVALVVYLPALRYGLVFDDLSLIGPEGPVSLGGEWLPYRPLRYLSLRLDFVLGGGRVWTYHATNLALHALACAALTSIAIRLGGRALLALLAGLTLAVHPLCVEVVAYVSGRRDLLAGLLGLCAIRAWMSDSGRTGLAVILLLAGVAAKESALVFWPVLLAASRFGFGPGVRYAMRALGWVLLAGIALPVAYGAVGPTPASWAWSGLVPVAGRTAAHYVGGLIWPARLSVEYPMLVCTDDCSQLIGWSAASGLFLLALTGLAAVALVSRAPFPVGGVSAARTGREGRAMPLAFALCWSTIVLFALAFAIGRHEPGADRHAYPLVAAVSVALALAVDRSGALVRRRAGAAVAARLVGAMTLAWLLALPVLAGATLGRLPAWESSRSLWEATVVTTPGSLRARYNIAAILAADGQSAAARGHLRAALRVRRDYGHAHAGLAWIDCRAGRLVRARRHIESAHELGAPFDLIVAAEHECHEAARSR